ncbi:sensory box sensor histidine kinase [Rhodopirellula maiorica SM1]|uniref:histidine kinase n=1 Tax=Rhodopirellula maiorica SM1 TaxID=1265738 RepID=M5RI35_9BACT|nr:ATP-binding protein [Rhodopirellula maiorica]EMI18973.1 sensory box sensor histidine kinase [Rhodopirellula maiorica SM1]
MRSSRLFWKLFLISVGLNLTLAVGFLFIVTSSQRGEINRQVEQRLFDTAVVLRSHVADLVTDVLDHPADEELDRQAQKKLQALIKRLASETQTRLTIIDGDGQVLAESERNPQLVLNHANRPEFQTASEVGRGVASRESPTLHIDMYYLALEIPSIPGKSAFVRVAIELETINDRVDAVRRSFWLLALLFGAIATGLTYAIVGRIINPLAQLTDRAQAIASGIDQAPVAVHSQDEVGLLAEAFNQMQSELGRRFRQLREKNEQMSTVLGSMDEGIIAIDRDQRIVLANDASKTLLSFTTANEVGRPLLEAVRSRPLYELVQKCLETGGPEQIEFESICQVRRDLAVSATCLPGDPANGVVMVLHNITELRRLENLRQEFVANVSHELKTPLASIKAFAETLRLGAMSDPENNLKFVDRIEEQAERLHQLILDMLQIARVESGEEAFEITDVCVNKVVETCFKHNTDAAERKEIQLVVEPPASPITVYADEDGLTTILDNLIGNAIKYTPENGRVTVRWHEEEDQMLLEVQDTGIGIAPEHHTRVFERFYRADKARSRELGGTGLGLSIVKHLCQAFGGSVNLCSRPGEGSTFQVRLPLS